MSASLSLPWDFVWFEFVEIFVWYQSLCEFICISSLLCLEDAVSILGVVRHFWFLDSFLSLLYSSLSLEGTDMIKTSYLGLNAPKSFTRCTLSRCEFLQYHLLQLCIFSVYTVSMYFFFLHRK